MNFLLEPLTSAGFSWKTAMSLAAASKLSYENFDAINRTAKEIGGFEKVVPIKGGSRGFIASAQGTAVVCLRGATNIPGWLGNLNIGRLGGDRRYGGIHNGFLSAAQFVGGQVAAFTAHENLDGVWFTGHGRGGAIATIVAVEFMSIGKLAGIYTFGQPLFASSRATSILQPLLGDRYIRFVNHDDIVAMAPPGLQHFGQLMAFNSMGNVEQSAAVSAPTNVLPTMELNKFKILQNELRQILSTIKNFRPATLDQQLPTNAETDQTLANISAEGLFPGIEDHAIGRYISLINRQISTVSFAKALSGVTVNRVNSDFGTREVFASFDAELLGRDDDLVFLPVLIRLRSADPWTPPPGIQVNSRIGTVVSARGTARSLELLEDQPDVASIEVSRDAGIEELDQAVGFVGGDQIHDGTLQDPAVGGAIAEKGDLALIGIIDSGVDVLHQSFLDANGSLRILAIWDQRDSSSNKTPHKLDPEQFSQDYGRLYLRADLAEVTDSTATPGLRDTREHGKHGTHVASIAAGRAVLGGPSSGMAPESRLVVVIPHMRTDPEAPPSLGYSASHVDALHFLRRISDGGTIVIAEQLPIAVNVSLGMNAGAHDGSSALEAAFDQISDGGQAPGFVVVKSAGNEFGNDSHVRLRLSEGLQAITWTTNNRRRSSDYIEIWYEFRDNVEFKLIDPHGRMSDVVSINEPEFKKNIEGVLWDLNLDPLHPDNGASLLRITVVAGSNAIPEGLWRLEITGISIRSEHGFLDAWVERDRARAVKFNNSDNLMTLSIPGTARTVICVGACHSQDPLQRAEFSSAGLTRDNRPKPDLCAPGALIAAAHAGTTTGTVSMPGTSMAAPIVTGALALAMSHRHKLGPGKQFNAMQYRSAILATLANFSRVHNEHIGFGRLDAKAFFDSVK